MAASYQSTGIVSEGPASRRGDSVQEPGPGAAGIYDNGRDRDAPRDGRQRDARPDPPPADQVVVQRVEQDPQPQRQTRHGRNRRIEHWDHMRDALRFGSLLLVLAVLTAIGLLKFGRPARADAA